MIEKLLFGRDGQRPEPASTRELQIKLNELIDVVKKQQQQLNNHMCRLVALEHQDEPDGDDAIQEVIHTDPYAEQRKWIGKLCKFWNFKDGALDIGVLKAVDNLKPTIPYINDIDCSYAFCEPVKPDDSIIYKGGDNE